LAARDPDLGIAARAQCAMVLAQVLAQSMHFDAAAAAADQAWSFYRDQGPSAQNERATILAVRAITGLSQGRSAALDAEIGAQMHELQTAGRGRGQAAQGLLNVWGSLAMVAGQPRKAVERYRKLLEIYEADQGATATVAYHHLTAAAAAIAAGLDDDAERWLAGGLDKARREQAQAVRAGLLCQRARLTALRGGDASAIRQWLDTADTHLSHADSLAPNQRLFCGLVRAEAAAMRGDAVAALAIVDAPTGMVSMPSIELTRNLIRARAHLAAGRHELARERAQAAAALALQLAGDGLSARLGEAWLLVGLAHRAAGDAAAAGAAWQQALAQLEATVEPGQWARRETTRQLRKD
jgi:tetratricopeptide (TPR) repeat protein